jgi:two-component sensor histidine kinase
MLTREMHRVKNSLASVVGLLRVQARNAQSEDVQNALKDAASRITTIAQVHDHLWRSKQIGFVDIADFAGELCHKLQETSPGHKLHCKFSSLMISADKAIPLGLLINELVTNAVKHAYPNGSGEIHVTGEQRGGELHVEVLDQGIGLPKDFDIDQPRASLGFKVIKSLLGQLDGRITVSSNQPKGATIQLDLPLHLRRNEGTRPYPAFPFGPDARNEVGHRWVSSLSTEGTQSSTLSGPHEAQDSFLEIEH